MSNTTQTTQIIDRNGLPLDSWYSNQVFIYPPVIDNTVTAYPVNSETLDVYFYFQNTDIDVDINKVIVSLTNRGKSVLVNSSFAYFETTQQNPQYSTNVDKTMYKITIPYDILKISEEYTDFRELLGSQLQIKIAVRRHKLKTHGANREEEASIEINYEGSYDDCPDLLVTAYSKNNLVMSEFSEPIPLYIIMPPNFKVYGGLSAQDVANSTAFPKAIGTNATNALLHYLYPAGEKTNLFYPESPDAYRIKGQLAFDTGYNTQKADGTVEWQTIDYAENDYLTWYQIQMYKENNVTSELVEDSQRLYPDRNWDFYYKAFAYTFKTDFSSQVKVGEYGTVTLLVVYKTAKGYLGTQELSMVVTEGVNEAYTSRDPDIYFKENSLFIEPDYSRGVVHLSGILLSDKAGPALGYMVYQRADLRKVSPSWETIAKCDFEVRMRSGSSTGESRFNFDDKTVEAGVPYKYRVRFYYKAYEKNTNQWSLKYANNELVDNNAFFLMSDDSFLMSKKNIFKIGYDASVSDLKRNIVDIVTPTLGGAYPFIRRNGAQKYHTFTIGGLISCAQENNDLPLEEELLEKYSIFNNDWFPSEGAQSGMDTYKRQKLYEKLYRQKIMDFLYEDQVVLFKSFQEGNMLVKLTNVNLTPVQGSDRHLYSFSATATEVDEPIAANYEKYFSDITEDIELSVVRYYILGDWGYRAWRFDKVLSNISSSLPSFTIAVSGTFGTVTLVEGTKPFQIKSISVDCFSEYLCFSVDDGRKDYYYLWDQGWSSRPYDYEPCELPDLIFSETLSSEYVAAMSQIANPILLLQSSVAIDVEQQNYYDAIASNEVKDSTPNDTKLQEEKKELYNFTTPIIELLQGDNQEEYITTIIYEDKEGNEITRTYSEKLLPGDYPNFQRPAPYEVVAYSETEDIEDYDFITWYESSDSLTRKCFAISELGSVDIGTKTGIFLIKNISAKNPSAEDALQYLISSFWSDGVAALPETNSRLQEKYQFASWNVIFKEESAQTRRLTVPKSHLTTLQSVDQFKDNQLLLVRYQSTSQLSAGAFLPSQVRMQTFWVNDSSTPIKDLSEAQKYYKFISYLDANNIRNYVFSKDIGSLEGLKGLLFIGTDGINATVEDVKSYMQINPWYVPGDLVLNQENAGELLKNYKRVFSGQTWSQQDLNITDDTAEAELQAKVAELRAKLPYVWFKGQAEASATGFLEWNLVYMEPALEARLAQINTKKTIPYEGISWIESLNTDTNFRSVQEASLVDIAKLEESRIPQLIGSLNATSNTRYNTLTSFLEGAYCWANDINAWSSIDDSLKNNYQFVSWLEESGVRQYKDLKDFNNTTDLSSFLNANKHKSLLLIGTDNYFDNNTNTQPIQRYMSVYNYWITDGYRLLAPNSKADLSIYKFVSYTTVAIEAGKETIVRKCYRITKVDMDNRRITDSRGITTEFDYLTQQTSLVFIGSDYDYNYDDYNDYGTSDIGEKIAWRAYWIDGITTQPTNLSAYSNVSTRIDGVQQKRECKNIAECDLYSLQRANDLLLIGAPQTMLLQDASNYLDQVLQYNNPTALLGEKRIYKLNREGT